MIFSIFRSFSRSEKTIPASFRRFSSPSLSRMAEENSTARSSRQCSPRRTTWRATWSQSIILMRSQSPNKRQTTDLPAPVGPVMPTTIILVRFPFLSLRFCFIPPRRGAPPPGRPPPAPGGCRPPGRRRPVGDCGQRFASPPAGPAPVAEGRAFGPGRRDPPSSRKSGRGQSPGADPPQSRWPSPPAGRAPAARPGRGACPLPAESPPPPGRSAYTSCRGRGPFPPLPAAPAPPGPPGPPPGFPAAAPG